jgi:anaerobic magnesium-protoporphyrin IX monomethyl ester cyclase
LVKKNKIILYRALDYKASRKNMPFGLLHIGSIAIEDGYEVVIIDGDQTRNPLFELDKVMDERVVCVGVSAMTGESIKHGLRLSKHVKDECNVPIIWGGIHATLLPEETVSNQYIDFVIAGEGEKAFPDFLRALRSDRDFSRIKGLFYKQGGRVIGKQKKEFIELNRLKGLHYELINVESYLGNHLSLPKSRRVFHIITNRGCIHKCGYCYNQQVNHGVWRSLSPEKIVDEVGRLREMFLVDGIEFAGDNFFVDMNIVKTVCQGLIERNLVTDWFANCCVMTFNQFDDEFIDLLKRSGCLTLHLGVESGSDTVLKYIRKGVTRKEVLSCAEKLKKHGLNARVFFMLGMPFETKDDVYDTVTLMEILSEYKNIYVPAPTMFCPWPGTFLFEESKRFGFNEPKSLEEWSNIELTDRSMLPFDEEYKDFLFALLVCFKVRSLFNNYIANKCLRIVRIFIFRSRFISHVISRLYSNRLELLFRRIYTKV